MNPERAPDYESESILVLGGDRTEGAVLLVEPVAGRYRLVGWERISQRNGLLEHPQPLPALLTEVCFRLGERLGRPLWDEETGTPQAHESEPGLGLAIGQVLAFADVKEPLQAWIGGLSAGESLTAASIALNGAYCQPAALYRTSGQDDVDILAREFTALQPDVAVVVGGYDRPRPASIDSVLDLCETVALAVYRLLPTERPLLCFAGSRWAASEARDLWQSLPGNLATEIVANVAPAPGIRQPTGLAVALSHHYWRSSRALSELQKISDWVTRPGELRSVHWAFAQGVRVWREVQGLPNLHGLHIGSRRRLHVWADRESTAVRVRFVEPGEEAAELNDWPPIGLVSGPFPENLEKLEPTGWHDPLGFVPFAAGIGQIHPDAALDVLNYDLLIPWGERLHLRP